MAYLEKSLRSRTHPFMQPARFWQFTRPARPRQFMQPATGATSDNAVAMDAAPAASVDDWPTSSVHRPLAKEESVSRRSLVSGLSASGLALLAPGQADALPAELQGSASWLAPFLPLPLNNLIPWPFSESLGRSVVEVAFRPKPEVLTRQKLNIDFAIMIMRSGYAVADDLDFMPMNEFQKRFYLLREREFEDYSASAMRTSASAIRNFQMTLDLSDPAYFDFVSFCQYATIAEGIRDGRTVFEELIDVNGTTRIVRRDSSLPTSNEALPNVLSERVGNSILAWIDERFPEMLPVAPQVSDINSPALLDGVRQVAMVFQNEGFMQSFSITALDGGGGFQWTLLAPCNLWSGQVLRLRGDRPTNDVEAKAMNAYLRRCGVSATYNSRISGLFVKHEFRWSEKLQDFSWPFR